MFHFETVMVCITLELSVESFYCQLKFTSQCLKWAVAYMTNQVVAP